MGIVVVNREKVEIRIDNLDLRRGNDVSSGDNPFTAHIQMQLCRINRMQHHA